MIKKILRTCMLLFTGLGTACSTNYPNQNPVGKMFPTVTGESLEKESVTLPTAYEGAPALYMVGYVQNTQFDLDRWTIGLLQSKFPCRIVEVPAIPGLIPGMIKGTIDDGMRSGIPREDWASVVTLYGGAAEPVAKFTGNDNPRNGRILLLDKNGEVVWFWDQGFSAKRVLELSELAGKMSK
ncbi:MAG: hypothetical protein CBC35_03485 [Planctomycetes bacterium TMED75]|nr:hypothetical protein [Planctomycetaceae bacterium]OUU94717.1 MAG: hypothetical protein CBC35_03485 [Planctomycetes bacterium TMED75]